MTANTNTSTQHDCADHGCLAAMLGVELNDNADEGSSSTW
jgi:hypothetical protein